MGDCGLEQSVRDMSQKRNLTPEENYKYYVQNWALSKGIPVEEVEKKKIVVEYANEIKRGKL